MKWVWVTLGLGAGFVLGTRAGRGRFDQMARWTKGAADDFGLSSASGQVKDSAKSVADDLHEAATAKAQDALGKAADVISDKLDSTHA